MVSESLSIKILYCVLWSADSETFLELNKKGFPLSLTKPQDKYRNGTFNSQAHGEATLNIDASCQ